MAEPDTGAARIEADLTKLRQLCERLVAAEGYGKAQAAQIVDVLMYAELRGNNQGLVKIVEGAIPALTTSEGVLTDRGSVVHLDAEGGNGMLVVAAAAEVAAARAREHGVAAMAISNTSGSTGAIGYYVRAMARQGVIGLLLGGTPKAVAPEGGASRVFGTNPLAFAFPRAGAEPVVLDMATSAVAFYGLIQARDRGGAIPADVALDAEGAPTTDPAAALAGAIRAFGGAKGSGLALMVELLTGALAGGGLPGAADADSNRGTLLIALDPAAFGQDVAAGAEATLAAMKGARPEPGGEILLPGERGDRLAADQMARGKVEIDQSLLDALHARAEEKGVR